MGTIIDLRLGNLIVDWGKNEIYSDHRALFQSKDVRSICQDKNNGGQEGTVTTLARSLFEIVPRLELLGYSLESAQTEYEELTLIHMSEGETVPTFDAFFELLGQVDIGTVSLTYEDDHSFGEFFREEVGPRLNIDDLFRNERSSRWNFAYMMESFNPWYVLVLFGQFEKNTHLPVIWDYFEHQQNGWSKADDFVPRLKVSDCFTIVTEGSSDSKILKKAFTFLQPAVSDFFTFIDMKEGYPFTGSGQLSNFCQGMIKIGVQNRMIIVFDNDAEGVSKHKSLINLNSLSTLQIIRLPDLPQLCGLAAVGTSGVMDSDVNGRAASIEAYLDLTWRVDRPALVRWTNYMPQVDCYQGSLDSKEHYTRRFLELRSAEIGYDFTKIRQVLLVLLKAASAISRANPSNAGW